MVPLQPAEGDLFVDRGFVPDGLKDPAKRKEGQPAGEVDIAGLARNPENRAPLPRTMMPPITVVLA